MTAVRPLMLAIQQRDLEAAKAALERDASQATDAIPGGLSPLMFALYNGALEIAQLLKAFRPLDVFEAAAMNDARRVAELVAAQPALPTEYSPDGWTPMHLAAFLGSREALFVLLGLGAPMEAISQNPMSNTPMHAAIAGPAGEALAPLLIGFGADVKYVGGSGVSALHLAASRGFDGLCKLLLSRGADRAGLTEDGKTAAEIARERGHLNTAAILDLAV
ncbi:ankyrin repeat domain-containing protein [Solimonas sp. SE-A11]|uniref:ankyrin repeat domain-containing protein n=1 Tax=Solimonas sp. SE-A11 TaxID=3054954 RepID=UPI00259CC8A7|nr:ankyrin repeat domain-containing protein [Solimonas sp. SE-A11]MDM4772787.1 ankyrin repeat domain-containing protein [Solimonas sp. SE-A11]